MEINENAASTSTTGLALPPQYGTTAPPLGGQYFTGDDLNKAREQEKQKLYPAMEKMREELEAAKNLAEGLAAKEAAREAERQRLAEEQAAVQQRLKDEEMSFKDLLQKKEEELTRQIESERSERERAFGLLEKEREYQALQQYRFQRLEQERDNIIPELIDLIEGTTADEVEQSIAVLKDKSARILNSAQEAMNSTRQQMVGTRITMPPSGPLDTDSAQNPRIPDNARDMSMADYIKNRDRLIGTANSRGQGLFS